MRLAVATASLDPNETEKYWDTWGRNAITKGYKEVWYCSGQRALTDCPPRLTLSNLVAFACTREVIPVAPAFARATRLAAEQDVDIIACLHDDVAIYEEGWDEKVIRFFRDHPACVLAGFGGALGLGRVGMYDTPLGDAEDIVSKLARHNFLSNMRDAEKHGRRETLPRRVACLDGFSLVGRKQFMLDAWNILEHQGFRHHGYDSAFGVLAAKAITPILEHRRGERSVAHWPHEVWLLPLSVHHAGGVTAVGSQAYQEWARTQHKDGDQGFWMESHRKLYELGRGVLPIRVEE